MDEDWITQAQERAAALDAAKSEQPQWVRDFMTVVHEVEDLHGKAEVLLSEPVRLGDAPSMNWSQRQARGFRDRVTAAWTIPLVPGDRKIYVGFAVDCSSLLLRAHAWNNSTGPHARNAKTDHCDPAGLRAMLSRVGLLPKAAHKTSTAGQLEYALKILMATTEGDLPRMQVEKILSDYRAGMLPRVR